ncbi:MAG: FAD-dependent oxidoreductase [Candidatus Eremiobacteraeota bacterium]|nr:FAD-dependent oxidoreductase [Candidatus Eremiobacteraeota bacterium]
MNDETHVRVAVIGGGCAGAYSALRLQRAERGPVVLFEYGDRIGGRLYSRTLPGMPHVHAEVGGMRFIREKHKLVVGMIEELGLKARSFPMGHRDPKIGSNQNFVYLRRRHLRYGELSNSVKVPYELNWPERDMNPDELQTWAYRYLVPNWDTATLDDLFKVHVFGKPLYKYGLWDLLYLVMSGEAYEFMRDAGGYDCNVANANAVSSLPSDDFGPTVVYETLVKGYDQLPIQTVNTFVKEGGEVRHHHRLKSIVRKDGGGVRLAFVRTETETANDAVRRTVVDTDDHFTVDADHVVLAMPRRSLELIDWTPLREDKMLRHDLKTVIKQAGIKLLLGYEYPWWKALGLEAGRLITDLPIRQVYYFGSEQEAIDGERGNSNALLMASYNDLSTLPFWKVFENDPAFRGRNPGEPTNPDVLNVLPQHHPATTGMVEMAQLLIAEVHGMRTLPTPYTAVFQDWTEDPFGAGWHAWKAGVDFRHTMKRIRKPIDDWPVYICGEAYSFNQGWVEGALQTAELMLEEHFGLNRPTWLAKDYSLGP